MKRRLVYLVSAFLDTGFLVNAARKCVRLKTLARLSSFGIYAHDWHGGSKGKCFQWVYEIDKHEQDVKKGMSFMQLACDEGDAMSCNQVANLYLSKKGDTGVARNPKAAIKLLEKACSGNMAPACHNLAVMYKNGDVGVPPYVEILSEHCSSEFMQ